MPTTGRKVDEEDGDEVVQEHGPEIRAALLPEQQRPNAGQVEGQLCVVVQAQLRPAQLVLASSEEEMEERDPYPPI